MPDVTLAAVVRECDRLLRPATFEDWSGACNGLQVENRGRVTRLAAAVDASPATAELALTAGADLLLVHHGLFWTPRHPWTGSTYRLQRRLFEGNLAVYSSHLPLDAHPRLGNNAQLCRALALARPRPFFECKGRPIGLRVATHIAREELARRLGGVLGSPARLISGGPPLCRQIGIVTGGAGAEVRQAAAEGVDTFITGEGPHWTFALAEELGVNLLYGGHYATETFGVKALAAHLARRFSLPWQFLDHPSGL
jgi:dinuclear metal center YbgI/SA1388 family protein